MREGRGRCHAPLKRFPYHLTSARRPAKDATRITSISSHQPARRPNCSPVFLSSPFTGICRLRLLCPGKRSKLCLTPLKVRISHFLQSTSLVCLNVSGELFFMIKGVDSPSIKQERMDFFQITMSITALKFYGFVFSCN